MTIPLYPQIIYDGDLTPDAVGREIDEKIEKIHAACQGFGTDELRLIKALASCTPQERAQVASKYTETHGKTLKKVMKSECGERDFGIALQLLAVSPDETDCDVIKRACKGVGTDELLLYPVICGRTNTEIDILKKKFYKVCTTTRRHVFLLNADC
jgi:annexin A7/11